MRACEDRAATDCAAAVQMNPSSDNPTGRLVAAVRHPQHSANVESEDAPDRPEVNGTSISAASHLSEETLHRADGDDHEHDDNISALSSTVVSPLMSRSPSFSSDRLSTVSTLTSYLPNNPSGVSPSPAFVSPSGASQIASESRGLLGTAWNEDEPQHGDGSVGKQEISFTESALALVNGFLDQLLYSFLSTARSTSLLALRPAVAEVLKSRLAKEAIASADSELSSLLADGDAEDEAEGQDTSSPNDRRWDVELVWKRTRLRVMVYMRLGEMEAADEERYVNQEELFHGNKGRFSQDAGLVSWAAAIFLTSVLEYVAEQTLQTASQAALTRTRRRERGQRRLTTEDVKIQERSIAVEDHDVEKTALNPTLGRLWRTWRKAQRSNATSSQNSTGLHSRNMSDISNRHASFVTAHEDAVKTHSSKPSVSTALDALSPDGHYPEHVLAANIPLPIGDQQRDVDEIEVPGLAKDPDAEDEVERLTTPVRRGSLSAHYVPYDSSNLPSEMVGRAESEWGRPPVQRKRSSSVPIEPPGIFSLRESSAMPGAFPDDPYTTNETETAPPADDGSNRGSLVQSQDVEANESVATPTAESRLQTTAHQPQIPKEALSEETAQAPVNPALEDDTSAAAQRSESLAPTQGHGRGLFSSSVGIAAAGIAALGSGAGALLHGTKDSGDKIVPSSQTPDNPPVDAQTSEPLHNNQAVAENAHELLAPVNPGERGTDESTTVHTNKSTSEVAGEVEASKIPERKSLIDIKSIIAASAASIESARQLLEASNAKNSAQSNNDDSGRNRRSRPRASEESHISYTLGPSNVSTHTEPPAEESDSVASKATALGATRTAEESTVDVNNRESGDSTKIAPKQQVEAARRPARLVIGTSPPRSPKTGSLENATPQRGSGEDGSRPTTAIAKTSTRQQPRPSPIQIVPPSQATTSTKVSSDGTRTDANVDGSPKWWSRTPTSATGTFRQDLWDRRQGRKPSDPALQETSFRQRIIPVKVTKSNSIPSMDTPLTGRAPEDFDSFVQGQETVKYTLTPENVRHESDAPSPTRLEPPRKLSAPHIEARLGKMSRSPSAATMVPTSPLAGPVRSTTSIAELRRSVSRPNTQGSRTSRNGPVAREPRVMTDSTRDFADFIRSTGPTKDGPLHPLMPDASANSLHSLRAAHINGASATTSRVVSRSASPGRDGERAATSHARSATTAEETPAVPSIPIKNRSAQMLQARNAKAATQGSSDLIDFIRSGPDERGRHRIPRTVAPFRTTMDSDQLRDLADQLSLDQAAEPQLGPNGSSELSIQSTSSAMDQSNRTSTNSRSALLHGPTVAQAFQPQRGRADDGRRRPINKDPYSTDFVDEDDDFEEGDDLLTALPSKEVEESSMIDSPRSPIPSNDPSTFEPRTSGNGPPPRTTSMPTVPNTILPRSHSPHGSRSATATPTHGPPPSTSAIEPPSRHRIVPSTASIRAASIRSTQGARSVASMSRSPAGHGSITPNGTPRRTATSDLADFLRNSGPIEDPNSAPAPVIGKASKLTPKEAEKQRKREEKLRTKETKKANGGNSGLGGFFSGFNVRRRTYLDIA